jgi:hypothetical protein
MTTLKDRDESTAAPSPKRAPQAGIGRRLGVFALILFLVGGLALGILLTSTAGDTDRPDATVLTQQQVTERLVRNLATEEVEIEVLYPRLVLRVERTLRTRCRPAQCRLLHL